MKFKANTDIEASIEAVFEIVSDFDIVERAAARRSVEVTRVEDRNPPAPGMAWDAGFRFRGKDRTARVTLTNYQANEALGFSTVTGGLETDVTLDLVALSPATTRLTVTADMSAKTLSARLLLQSMKLAKGKLQKRFGLRIDEIGTAIQDRAKGVA